MFERIMIWIWSF